MGLKNPLIFSVSLNAVIAQMLTFSFKINLFIIETLKTSNTATLIKLKWVYFTVVKLSIVKLFVVYSSNAICVLVLSMFQSFYFQLTSLHSFNEYYYSKLHRYQLLMKVLYIIFLLFLMLLIHSLFFVFFYLVLQPQMVNIYYYFSFCFSLLVFFVILVLYVSN